MFVQTLMYNLIKLVKIEIKNCIRRRALHQLHSKTVAAILCRKVSNSALNVLMIVHYHVYQYVRRPPYNCASIPV